MEHMDRYLLEKAIELRSHGMSCKAISEKLMKPNATIDRWLKRFDECGGDIELALEPRTLGRPVIFEPNAYEISRARWYRLSKESLTVAAWFFARDEHVDAEGNFIRPEIRQVILDIEEKAARAGKEEQWTDSIRRAFRVTDEEKAAFRSRKAVMGAEMVTRRGMFEVLADGTSREILTGECWEMDDYSTNQPFVFKDPSTREFMLGRQVLACRELAAAKWLGFDHIGRERDAYRGEDIVRFIGRLVRTWGLPRRLRLERGTWESSAVHGIEVDGMAGRWGDLRELMEIEHVFKSKSKVIEGGFNVLQRWLGHTGTDIGRTRGEFEEATRRFLQAKRSGADPLALGFLPKERSSALHEEAAALINSRPMFREHLGERVSPDDLTARQGWNTRPWRAEDEWYFLPYKMLRTVRAGTVNVSPGNGWPKMYFKLNGVAEGVHFETGHQVLIAFDPARQDRGAYVANADRSARNREGWRMAQPLLTAAPEMGLAPQFSAAASLSPHMVVRKRASAAAATAYRSVRAAAGTPQPNGSREAMATNGRDTITAGDIQRHESTAPAAEIGPVPDSVRPVRISREIRPATSSRAMPADAAAEIARLKAALIED